MQALPQSAVPKFPQSLECTSSRTYPEVRPSSGTVADDTLLALLVSLKRPATSNFPA